MSLHRMTYLSSANRPMSTPELEALLRQSQGLNARADVSGLLLYHNGSFLQVLEGPEPSVRDTMSRIKADPRHHRVMVVEDRPVETREFLGWTMAFEPEREWRPAKEAAFAPLAAVARGEVVLRATHGEPCPPFIATFFSSIRGLRPDA